MTDTTVTHGSFTLERVYNAPVSRVYKAYTDAEARHRWLIRADDWTVHEYRPAPRPEVGATEFSKFSPPGARVVLTNETVFLDVQENDRVIVAYAMTLEGAPLSSSLLTTEFRAEPDGKTRIILTEQGAYLDGNVKGREAGTRIMLERFAKEVEPTAVG
ncbi:activator of HSP90 ATPase [Kaistia sp. 32K]|uniref:SRPBCC domain-containing protein n=1 Tax=Kaistia sp. 32K TaxID=2795690 RepID=UPI0019155FBC|nr:SRPBCC domain-containing protein [Kaistia sp. 32K]BCP52236.1 activator of HSP90 ATPase [Kaistia sp. 32K]